MQVVILAAGEASRLRPLSFHVPKALVKIAGKTLVEHNLDALNFTPSEIIFVVGHLKEQIINYFGSRYNGINITYAEQKKPLGTGHALQLASKYLKNDFLVFMGDDIYSREDIGKISACTKSALLVRELRSSFVGGRVLLDKEGKLQDIKEGRHKNGLVNAALYKLNTDFFNYGLVSIKDGKEYGLPQQLVCYAQEHLVEVVSSKFWL